MYLTFILMGPIVKRRPTRALQGTGLVWVPTPQNMSSSLRGPVQTNNRAELTACIEALKAIPFSRPVCIITDSKYIYDGVTAYMHRWALQGRHVTIQDLWDSLRSVLRARTVETLWKYVYSHVGVLVNNARTPWQTLVASSIWRACSCFVICSAGRALTLWSCLCEPPSSSPPPLPFLFSSSLWLAGRRPQGQHGRS